MAAVARWLLLTMMCGVVWGVLEVECGSTED